MAQLDSRNVQRVNKLRQLETNISFADVLPLNIYYLMGHDDHLIGFGEIQYNVWVGLVESLGSPDRAAVFKLFL